MRVGGLGVGIVRCSRVDLLVAHLAQQSPGGEILGRDRDSLGRIPLESHGCILAESRISEGACITGALGLLAGLLVGFKDEVAAILSRAKRNVSGIWIGRAFDIEVPEHLKYEIILSYDFGHHRVPGTVKPWDMRCGP